MTTIGEITEHLGGSHYVVGFRDGSVESFRGSEGSILIPTGLADTPSSSATQINSGPEGTVALGFSDGTFGLWSLEDLNPIKKGKLNGAVLKLIFVADRLLVLSDLGDKLEWDLSVFQQSRCEFMRDVWSAVPVLWKMGEATVFGIPDGHECAWD